MTDRQIITVEIPAMFNASPAIYSPRLIRSGNPRVPDETAYMAIFPFDDRFTGCRTVRNEGETVCAKSRKQPIIMIGDDNYTDKLHWRSLIERATDWRIPLDTLLLNRPLKLAVRR